MIRTYLLVSLFSCSAFAGICFSPSVEDQESQNFKASKLPKLFCVNDIVKEGPSFDQFDLIIDGIAISENASTAWSCQNCIASMVHEQGIDDGTSETVWSNIYIQYTRPPLSVKLHVLTVTGYYSRSPEPWDRPVHTISFPYIQQ